MEKRRCLFLIVICFWAGPCTGQKRVKKDLVSFDLGGMSFALPSLKLPELKMPDLSRWISPRRSDGRRMTCTTPQLEPGFCENLSQCPSLIFDFDNLRKSICFQDLFVPGVCCPDPSHNALKEETTTTTTTTTTTARPTTRFITPAETTTFSPPTKRPLVELASEVAAPSIVPTRNVTRNYFCGQRAVPKFRIIGGSQTYHGKWPWMAAIFLHGPKAKVFHCGGSVVSENFVITAAHCTMDPNGATYHHRQFTIRLGDDNIYDSSDDSISNAQTYRVTELKVHPSFHRPTFSNDVALFRTDRQIEYSDYVIPLCLPATSLALEHTDALAGEYGTVIGYGKTAFDGHESAYLREIQLPIWRNSDCDRKYFQSISRIFLCAGLYEGGKDACQGDSGGPLQLFVEGRWTLIGLVSFGDECALPAVPGVYTRITEFLPWIQANIR